MKSVFKIVDFHIILSNYQNAVSFGWGLDNNWTYSRRDLNATVEKWAHRNGYKTEEVAWITFLLERFKIRF